MKPTIIQAVLIFFHMHYFVDTAGIGEKCDPDDLTVFKGACPKFAVCEAKKKVCECLSGYYPQNNNCVPIKLITPNYASPNSSSLVDQQTKSHVVAGILIPLFLIVFIVCASYFVRRYKLFSWLRSKLPRRNSNYDEFMIGQDDDDDPPLR